MREQGSSYFLREAYSTECLDSSSNPLLSEQALSQTTNPSSRAKELPRESDLGSSVYDYQITAFGLSDNIWQPFLIGSKLEKFTCPLRRLLRARGVVVGIFYLQSVHV